MKANVQKWGNSLAIRIPKSIADRLEIQQGAEVDLSVEDQKLVVTAVPPDELDRLLKRVTPENRHHELDWGSPTGAETW